MMSKDKFQLAASALRDQALAFIHEHERESHGGSLRHSLDNTTGNAARSLARTVKGRELDMPEAGKCWSCGAAILWARTAKTGSLTPLDAEPCPDGNMAILDGAVHVFSGDLFEEMIPAGPRYRSHFATCPNAAKHRKSRSR